VEEYNQKTIIIKLFSHFKEQVIGATSCFCVFKSSEKHQAAGGCSSSSSSSSSLFVVY
jgi:hypothetical protein